MRQVGKTYRLSDLRGKVVYAPVHRKLVRCLPQGDAIHRGRDMDPGKEARTGSDWY